MQITHKLNSFLYSLFNIREGETDRLISELQKFYTLNAVVPIIKHENDFISVSVDIDEINLNGQKYNQLIFLCENRKFSDAYPIAVELCKVNATNSDLFRIKGQIESELGKVEKSIDSLIDALRWDPENVYALIMMGNIFARDKSDVETAMKYYKQASVINPDDHISLNNIGANLLALENFTEAEQYFIKADKIDSTYPNTQYALGLLSFKKQEYDLAFKFALKSIKLNTLKDGLFNNSISLIKDISAAISNLPNTNKILQNFISEISDISKVKIEIEIDNSIPTIAKVEYAENHNREFHLIKYKAGYQGYIHLILHELIHIELSSEAKITDENLLYISSKSDETKFLGSYQKYHFVLKKKGYSEESITSVIKSLFEGLSRQIFNTPIDLFIEDRIFKKFQDFQAIQFISLFTIVQEGLDAVTRKDIIELIDPEILSKSKVYNLVTAMQFKDLYGVDYIKYYKASTVEFLKAKAFYDEFEEYRNNKEPGEEYELVENWAKDLNLNQYFKLINESEYREKKDSKFNFDIGDNPDEDIDANQKISMHTFLEEHSDQDLNPAVMMHMVGALKYFKDKNKSEIKVTAFQIASLGMSGISPEKSSGYSVASIEGSDFSGYQMLAYYYVSWALSVPEVLPELQLPFDKEYDSAKAFFKS